MYAYVYKMSLKVVGQCAEKVLHIFAHYLYESKQELYLKIENSLQSRKNDEMNTMIPSYIRKTLLI